jgi:hypothetical protein
MRIDFILNPVKNPGPDNFYFEQPFTCRKTVKVVVANIENVCFNSAMVNNV